MDTLYNGASPRPGNGCSFGLGLPRNLSSPAASYRLVLLAANHGPDGVQRVALLPPGARAVPTAYTSVAAALAALRSLETAP